MSKNGPNETEAYAGIVAAVKAEAVKQGPGKTSGDQVSWEIQRRWAKHNGRPFDTPPPGAGGIGSSALGPPGIRGVSPIKALGKDEGQPVALPEDKGRKK